MRRLYASAALFLLPVLAMAQELPAPIIDMQLHAEPAAGRGEPPLAFCLPTVQWPIREHTRSWRETFIEWEKNPTAVAPDCEDPIWSPLTDEALMRETFEVMERRNVIGVTSGPLTDRWYEAAPDRIIPSLMFSVGGASTPPVDSVRAWIGNGRYVALGEILNQYRGITPDDERMAPYWALAEELDVPVGIHIGPGPPGTPYLGFSEYRARHHSPLLLEEVLLRHPDLRVYIQHAGWPMLDDLMALMWAHPQVYVDLGVISFAFPRAEFHYYLRRLVGAGFGKRVMFGSDQMVWPEALEAGIEAIEAGAFLTEQQKRDILYNNAARFLRLSEEEIARHHGR